MLEQRDEIINRQLATGHLADGPVRVQVQVIMKGAANAGCDRQRTVTAGVAAQDAQQRLNITPGLVNHFRP